MATKKRTKKVSMPTMYRSAHFEPKSINIEERTVDLVWTTGSRVLRGGFFSEPFFEELGLKKGEVRMGRLESGAAPLLDNHGLTDKAGIRSQIGVIDSATLVSGKEGRAKVRFSKRAEVDDIFQDVQDGIIRNVSVGYNVFRSEKVGEENDTPIFRAVDWEPVEVSLVPAGADAGAQVRSKDAQTHECIVIEEIEETENTDENTDENIGEKRDIENETTLEKTELENKTIDKNKNIRQNESIEGDINEMDKAELAKIQKEAREQGIADENKRQIEIRSIVKKVSLKDELAETYIAENKTIDEVRTLVIDALAAGDSKEERQTKTANVTAGEDLSRKGRIEGMTSAILHKFRPTDKETVIDKRTVILKGYELNEAGRPFAYRSLVDMARECLRGSGVDTDMLPKHAIADAALNNYRGLHSTSDFPEILANVANKTLRSGYLAAPKTWGAFTNEVFVSDFKEISRTNLGDAPQLEKLNQGAEVKRGTMSEAAEKYQVEEFAKIIGISRVAIINDDLNAFTKIPERMGRRAADLESDTVWNIIKANANLADGFALYSAQHSNLSVLAGAPSEARLGEARASVRRQLGLDGAEISLTPIWLYVPPEHETTAEKLLASIIPDSSSNVSPFSSAGRTPLRLDVEPRLETGSNGSTDAWYIMADTGQIDMIELARLEGSNGPSISTRDGFDISGMEIKISHDIGAKAIDFRGLFKNAGA